MSRLETWNYKVGYFQLQVSSPDITFITLKIDLLHSKRTRDVTRLVTRVGSCNGLQGCYKLVMIAFKACNAMQACNDQPMLVLNDNMTSREINEIT